MNIETSSGDQAVKEPSVHALRAAFGRWSGRWTPALAVIIATVRADRMDELERLHDAYSID